MCICRQHPAGTVMSRTVGREVLICFALFSFFPCPACLLARRHAPQRDTDLLTTLLIRGGKGVYPWLAMLRGHLTNTTDAYQLNRFANG